jgi:hypothetical protein
MGKTGKQEPHLTPDRKWLPLLDGLIHHASTTAIEFASVEMGNQRWSDLPRAIKPSTRFRSIALVFNDGGAVEVEPWELLRDEVLPSNPAQRATLNAVRQAWRVMTESFGSAISSGRYALYGRSDLNAGFAPIPPDDWVLYRVVDWSSGRAIAPDGREVWSIHTLFPRGPKPQSGRKPVYDQDQINGEVRRLLRKFGPYGPDKEQDWQTRADLEERVAQFLFDTLGQSPAKSTLQDRVKRALAAIEAETA